MEEINFCGGVLYGFVGAGIIASVMVQIRDARKRAGAKSRPLDAFPDKVQPNLTPQGITSTSTAAGFEVVVWTIILLLSIAGFVGGALLLSGELEGLL